MAGLAWAEGEAIVAGARLADHPVSTDSQSLEGEQLAKTKRIGTGRRWRHSTKESECVCLRVLGRRGAYGLPGSTDVGKGSSGCAGVVMRQAKS